jgi:ribosomal protein S18 acetylase RimI-like enzyme
MEIREINEGEVPVVKDLIHHTIKSCYPGIYPPKVVNFFLNYHSLQQIQKRRNCGTLLVLISSGEIRGTGFIDGSEMGGVYVHPQHQGKGYGTRLVLRLMEIASEKKLPSIWLDATPLAKPLYDKLGFTLLSPMQQYVENSQLDYFKMEMIFSE